MTAILSSQLHLLEHQHAIAIARFQRGAVVLDGSLAWQNELIEQFAARFPIGSAFQLGGEPYGFLETIPSKQGKCLLGREVNLLVVTLTQDFDANSFNAALGALVGGGVLLLLCNDTKFHPWLERHLSLLPKLNQASHQLVNDQSYWQPHPDYLENNDIYAEQKFRY